VEADSHHHHAHPHEQGHGHGHHHGGGNHLVWALVATLGFAFVEVLTGYWAGSLALVSDAGHMFSDAVALGIAAFAGWVSKRPPSHRHSYGFARAEVIAALVNSVIMLSVITFIVVEAVQRLHAPQPVAGGAVMVVAFLGLLINVVVAFILSGGGSDLNTRTALLHVIGDMLGSFAALLAGAVIYFSGWMPIDPILSLFVAALILYSALDLLREALHVLMEGVPLYLKLEQVGEAMARVEGVRSVHDLHIWTLSSGMVALSAHMELEALAAWPDVLTATRSMLLERFAIDHVTLQPEVPPQTRHYETRIPIYPGR
jgi:cobalt-zinc-cadmium efflux system protein